MPVVTSSIGAEGLTQLNVRREAELMPLSQHLEEKNGAEQNKDERATGFKGGIVADTDDTFIDAALKLYLSPLSWVREVRGGMSILQDHFGEPANITALRRSLINTKYFVSNGDGEGSQGYLQWIGWDHETDEARGPEEGQSGEVEARKKYGISQNDYLGAVVWGVGESATELKAKLIETRAKLKAMSKDRGDVGKCNAPGDNINVGSSRSNSDSESIG